MTIDDKFDFMATGKMYNDLDPELVIFRQDTVFKTNEYNASFGEPENERELLLKTFVGSIGEHVHFEPTFRCEFGRNIHIGDNFYANFDCIMLDGAPITIGDNVLFGPRTSLYTSNHALDPVERRKGGCIAKPITINSGVWFGGDVKVAPGVTIGENSIIGTGSVVTHSIPANVVAAGVPCKVLRSVNQKDKTDYLSHF